MKVLLVHNRYQERGGEDAVFEAERALLEQAGAQVAVHEVANDVINTLGQRISAFARVARNDAQVLPLVERARGGGFDVVHVHNFFPLLSPFLHQALAGIGLPVVQTLHNYRLLCANGMLMRQDRICELCLSSRHHALVHRCYRGSLMGTLAVLRAQRSSIGNPDWINAVSRFIALSSFAKAKFASAGLPVERIAVKPNSIPDPGAGLPGDKRDGALFVGRVAPGKGVSVLLQAWRKLPDIPLTIIGAGPELERARAEAPADVLFAGIQPREEVLAQMKRAAFLIMPSTWYEGFPVTLVEALACGLPVIASRLGGLPEIVADGESGFLFSPNDALALSATVRKAFADPSLRSAMVEKARASYETRFLPEHNAQQLLAIYHDAISHLKATRQLPQVEQSAATE